MQTQLVSISKLGSQFGEPGVVFSSVEPLDMPPAHAIDHVTTCAVAMVLYRRTPDGVVVFLPWLENMALNGRGLPTNDSLMGDTVEATFDLTARRYLGFVPVADPARFTEVCTILVQVARGSRSPEPRQLVYWVWAYEMADNEVSVMRPGCTAQGELSPRDGYSSGKWFDPREIVEKPDTYGPHLAKICSDFIAKLAKA